MLRVGIGRAYRDQSLRNFGDAGQRLRRWMLDEDGRGKLRQGRGWTITGPSITSLDLTITFARAVHLYQMSIRVVSVAKLLFAIDKGAEEFDRCDEVQCLFVSRFYTPPGNRPFSPWQRLQTEDFLMDRLENGRAVVLHTDRTLEQNDPGQWWTAGLVQRLIPSHPPYPAIHMSWCDRVRAGSTGFRVHMQNVAPDPMPSPPASTWKGPPGTGLRSNPYLCRAASPSDGTPCACSLSKIIPRWRRP